MTRLLRIIFGAVAFVLLIVIIFTGLFNIWIFIGLVIMGLMYLFGYLYVLSYYRHLEEVDRKEKSTKEKFDYCWNRTNEILKRMVGGQGLSWSGGTGRKSEYRSFHDGIQLRGFRSVEAYLAGSQQLVVVIYDIEKDDIVRYYANPDPLVISNHFHDFKPFQGRDGFQSGVPDFRRGSRSRVRRRPSTGITIHHGDDDFDSLDSFGSKAQPSEGVVSDGLKKLQEGGK